MKDLLELPDLFQKSETVLTAEVAVPLPVEGVFTYLLPAELAEAAKPGVRVRVPFKNQTLTAYLVGKSAGPKTSKLKSILEILDEEPVLTSNILELTRWISETYGSSWGEAIENALPKWVKYGKKATQALLKGEKESALPADFRESESLRKLSGTQTEALTIMIQQMESPVPKPILLFGVTGSGKSEVYLRAIRETLFRKRTAICLVPEIALTEQLRHFFLQEFGERLEILHSKLSDGERFLAWKRLERGQKSVILGPRSAVFAPVPNLGLLIMDEEHEGSYKQDTTPRYHAREVAAWRAEREGALFVMGSATPSLETMYAARSGKFLQVNLPGRIEDRPMPRVQLLDLKTIQQDRKKRSILTPSLTAEIQRNLEKKEGTMLLLNRRGFSTQIQCQKCGEVENCRSCQVGMTFHQDTEMLLCHYCNYQKPVTDICSKCSTPLLRFTGFGTEKVESEVASLFPSARISRMDADSVRQKGMHEKILGDFRDRKTDILIGTQMIAKGFDFPHVTLVGVILADVGLMLPDFRSAERTFQLLTQVAGRSGRGTTAGRVFIQTYSPEHPSIHYAKTHDYQSFYEKELAERKSYRYPPFYKLINIIIRAKDEAKAYKFGHELRDLLKSSLPELAPRTDSSIDSYPGEIIGPAPLPFYKLRGQFRWHVMVKSVPDLLLTGRIKKVLAQIKRVSGIQTALDIDPLSIL